MKKIAFIVSIFIYSITSAQVSTDANGNVGIGTTTPQAKLDVSGNIVTGAGSSINGVNAFSVRYSGAETISNWGSLRSSNGTYMGFGVKASSTTGDGWLSTTTLNLGRSSVFIDSEGFKFAVAAAQTTAVNSPVTMSEIFRINSSGNVGIGTISPQAKLDVRGGIFSTASTIESYSPVLFLKRDTPNGGYIQGIQSQLQDGTNNWFFGNYGDDTWVVSKGDYDDSNKLTIKGNGNIGINNTSPQAKLHVSGNLKVDDNFDFFTGTNKITGLGDGANYYMGHFPVTGSSGLDIHWYGGIKFGDRTGDVLHIKNGNVGIGTGLPLGLLHVGDDTGAGIVFANKISSVPSQIPAQLGWGDSTIGLAGDLIISPRTSIANNSVRFFTNNGQDITERFRISGNGNIGIGVLNPQYKLDVNGKASFNDNIKVNGKIESKEIKVTATPTADFVFENDYPLPTLESVEKHIKEKKHLPEVASAKQMEQEGVNVGEFQIKLLQKIEELTLYVIEQNKKISKLEEEVKALKK